MTDVTRPLGAQDPREVLDWAVDWTGICQTGEVISTVTWTVAPAGIGLVLTPLSLVGMVAYARLEVSAAEQSHARWDQPGVLAVLTCEIATTDQREITRTIPVRVARGVKSSLERTVVAS